MTPDGTPAEHAACTASTPADGIMVGCELDAHGPEVKHRGTYVHEFAGVAVDVEVSWWPDDPGATKACGCGPLEPCKSHLGAGDLQDWEARARAAEAKLGTLRGLCREHGSTLTPGDVLRIIEEDGRG